MLPEKTGKFTFENKINMKTKIYLIIVLIGQILYSQNNNGYWDSDRKTTANIKLAKGEMGHLEVKLPPGTTEIAYRIIPTSKYIGMVDDFAESLKRSGFKQAQAIGFGASFLSKLSGDVKCKYGIFKDIQGITNFYKTSDFSKGCLVNYQLIDKMAINNLYKSDLCLNPQSSSIWFAFKSENFMFEQTVIVEVVPWIDNSASNNLNKIANDNELNTKRQNAAMAAKINDFTTAINIFTEIVNSGNGTSMDYNSLGWYYLLTKQYFKALKFLNIGDNIDDTNLFIKGNLAHAYLLTGEIEKAKEIYIKYKGQNINETISWTQMVFSDFQDFKSRNINSPYFETITNLLQ